MNPELVIFDCDGVLVDSEAIVIEIESDLLTRAGFAMSIDDCAEHCVGLSWPDVMAMLEERFGRAVPVDLSSRIQEKSLEAFPSRLEAGRGSARLERYEKPCNTH